MTSHCGNEDVNECTRRVFEWLSSDATHRKMFVDAVVAVFLKEELSPEPELADLAKLDKPILLLLCRTRKLFLKSAKLQWLG